MRLKRKVEVMQKTGLSMKEYNESSNKETDEVEEMSRWLVKT